MNQGGQAYSTFKLLIAAIVAMAILAILIPVIIQAMGFVRADPTNETRALLSEMLNLPGAVKFTPDLVFENGDVLSASSLANGLPLSEDQICFTIWHEVYKNDAEGNKEGTIMDNFGVVFTDSGGKIVYVGETSATVRIGVVCNKDVDALIEDIAVHAGQNADLTKMCKVCEGKGKCCAVRFQRT
jgi:hypothetical protein